ncbi:MAG TPA: hypothetical protein VHG93_14675, partial [Longimicrobium sp.]|nr:hypothetical protein [Longimicrobium sp.]
MGQSNRSYTFEYIAGRPIPFAGEGLGNANITFSNAMGSAITMAFLSLYFNTVMSTGVIGLAMLLVLLALPMLRLAAQPRYRSDTRLLPPMGAYVGWLLMFTIHSEELGLVFGVIYGLLAWEGAGRPLVLKDDGAAAA